MMKSLKDPSQSQRVKELDYCPYHEQINEQSRKNIAY